MEHWAQRVIDQMDNELKELIGLVKRPHRTRVMYALINHNVLTIQHRINLKVYDVVKWRNVGPKSLKALHSALEQKGHSNSVLLESISFRLKTYPKLLG